MNYYVHVHRMLNKIFPEQLLLRGYKSYIQSKLGNGRSIWGCTTEGNLDRVQSIQNSCARFICQNYDHINTRGRDLVASLGVQTIRQRRDYFLSVLIFKCIHDLAPHYLCNDVTMIADVHDYNTRRSENGICMYKSVTKNFANAVLYTMRYTLELLIRRRKRIWFPWKV